MLFEKVESKLDHFGHSPKLILAEFDFFLYSPKLIPAKFEFFRYSPKLIPPNCIEIAEWADSPKFLPAKISSLKVIKILPKLGEEKTLLF